MLVQFFFRFFTEVIVFMYNFSSVAAHLLSILDWVAQELWNGLNFSHSCQMYQGR